MSIHTVDRKLDSLTYSMRSAATEVLARCAERKIPMIVLETGRTIERARHLVSTGASRTTPSRSFHTPGPDGLSAAMDAAPVLRFDEDVIKAINWDASHKHWQIYVEIASKLGLECGGLWTSFKDWSHIQLQRRR